MIFTDYGLPTILLPFVIGIIGNMITGSTTVGVITAASLVAPTLSSLSLFLKLPCSYGASGSVIIKYVNSSYFWVCIGYQNLQFRTQYLAMAAQPRGRNCVVHHCLSYVVLA